MKEKDRLNILFDQARSEKPIVNQNHIDELVRSGKQVSAKKIKLGKAGRGLFNPLNLIIMISTIAIIVTSLFFIFNGTRETSQERQKVPASAGMTSRSIQQQKIAKEIVIPAKAGTSGHTGEVSKNELTKISSPFASHDELQLSKAGEKENIVDLSDTLIIGEVLHLTQEELSRLGFLFNDEGFFYLNKLKQGYMNFYSDKNPESKLQSWSSHFGIGNQPVNVKKEITEFSFYPSQITGIAGERLQEYSPRIESASRSPKDYYDDLAVPVYFPGRWFVDDFTSDRIIWFNVSEEFFDILPPDKIEASKARIELVKRLREIPENKTRNFVEYDLPGLNTKTVNPIELERNSMIDLGLNVSIKGVVYRYQFENRYVTLGLYNEGSSFKASADAVPEDLKYDNSYNTPMLGTTRLNGEYSVGISVEFYPEITDTVDFFSNMHDVSVPVRFVDDSLPEVVRNTIFWYFPTEEFFESLPDSIGIPMAREYYFNVTPKLHVFTGVKGEKPIIRGVLSRDEEEKTEPADTIPCEFFPSFCEGLPGLDNLNVYPNPATDLINIEVTISRGKSIDYRVFDLSGRLMVDDVETREYQDAGLYKQQIDVSDLTEGFYLLVLSDEEGAKMTKRIVKN